MPCYIRHCVRCWGAKQGGSPLSKCLQSAETDIEQIIKQAVGFPHGFLQYLLFHAMSGFDFFSNESLSPFCLFFLNSSKQSPNVSN